MADISASVLETLKKYDTPTICNVIELFDVRPRNQGYMNKTIKAAFPDLPPMVGFAATATHRSYVNPMDKSAYSALTDQIERFSELSGPPIIVFQDLDGDQAAATFGEVMCSTYRAFGSVGLITSGPGRDMEQVRAIDFPVFTDGIVCSHGYNHIIDVHVPVQVGGITVSPNDLLHGDVNGVTDIPLDIASDIADACSDFIAAEMVVIDLSQNGSPTLAEWKEANAEKNQMIADLKKRITKA